MKRISWTAERCRNRPLGGLPPEELDEPSREFDDFDYYSDEEDEEWISNSNYSEESPEFQICRTKYGAIIETDGIPRGVLDDVKLFYVCEQCGKCYWDGSHRDRALGGFIGQIVRR